MSEEKVLGCFTFSGFVTRDESLVNNRFFPGRVLFHTAKPRRSEPLGVWKSEGRIFELVPGICETEQDFATNQYFNRLNWGDDPMKANLIIDPYVD